MFSAKYVLDVICLLTQRKKPIARAAGVTVYPDLTSIFGRVSCAWGDELTQDTVGRYEQAVIS